MAVVVDLNKTGALIARCLGRAGVRVTGAHTVRQPAIGASSRYVEGAMVQPGLLPAQLLEILLRLTDRAEGKSVLMCATDEAVDFCSRYRGALEERFHLPSAQSASLHELLDKGRQGVLAARSGLDVPPTVVVRRDNPESLAQLASVPLPAIVKPGNSLFGYKRFMGVEQTLNGLEARVAATLPHCPRLLVSAYVPGEADANYTVMGLGRREGPPLIAAVTRKLRQVPRLAYGSASLAETCVDDELSELSARFIRDVVLAGPFELEFKREGGSGRPWFIEANFRFSALVEMTATAGMNLPYLVYLDALGVPLCDKPCDPPRVLWVDEFRDWKLCANGQVSLDELLGGYSGVNCLSLFDRDDPAPFELALRNARTEAGADLPLFEQVLARLLTAFESARQIDSRPVATPAGERLHEVRS